MSKTHEDFLFNINTTKQILSNAGFIINEKKSSFEPSQHILFIGFTLDLVTMTVSLPEDKRKILVDLCEVLKKPYPYN